MPYTAESETLRPRTNHSQKLRAYLPLVWLVGFAVPAGPVQAGATSDDTEPATLQQGEEQQPDTPPEGPGALVPPPDDQPDEFVQKLLQRAAGQGDDEEVIQRIMRLMEASRLRLAGHFDPGPRTQRIQRRILEEMNEAIQRARQQRSNQSQQPQQRSGERRQRGQRQKKQPDEQTSAQDAQNRAQSQPASEDDQATKGKPDEGPGNDHARPTARRWGHLPPRDREAILQGIKDEYLPKFKEMIERYYQALGLSSEPDE